MREKMDETQLRAVHKVIQLMEEEYGRTLSLSEMADYALYSPYHFNRLFQKASGITPSLFLSTIRIEKGKELLLETDLDLATISSYVGYTSISTFSRQFKKYVGLSPLQFRKNSSLLPDVLDHIDLIHEPNTYTNHRNGVISGNVSALEGFKGVIFLALFTEPIPHGQPVACTIVKKPGSFQLKRVPDGTYYLMSVAFSNSTNIFQYLYPNKALRGIANQAIIIQNGKVTSNETDVHLRHPLPSDPPISVSIPYLITNFLEKFRENKAI